MDKNVISIIRDIKLYELGIGTDEDFSDILSILKQLDNLELKVDEFGINVYGDKFEHSLLDDIVKVDISLWTKLSSLDRTLGYHTVSDLFEWYIKKSYGLKNIKVDWLIN